MVPRAGLDIDGQEAEPGRFSAERGQRLADLAASIQRGGKIQITITCSKQTCAPGAAELGLCMAVGVYATPAGDDDETVALLPDVFEIA